LTNQTAVCYNEAVLHSKIMQDRGADCNSSAGESPHSSMTPLPKGRPPKGSFVCGEALPWAPGEEAGDCHPFWMKSYLLCSVRPGGSPKVIIIQSGSVFQPAFFFIMEIFHIFTIEEGFL